MGNKSASLARFVSGGTSKDLCMRDIPAPGLGTTTIWGKKEKGSFRIMLLYFLFFIGKTHLARSVRRVGEIRELLLELSDRPGDKHKLFQK